jgi:heme exporter protein C
MMRGLDFSSGVSRVVWQMVVGSLMFAAVLAACVYAPTESTMGHAQRIVYLHVPVAWLGLLAFLVMAACGITYLVRRELKWDHWCQAAGESGWICCSLTLVTGSLWAHEAWGTWWEWDPRLTTAFILWAVYSGILMVRSSLEDPHRRARVGAVLAILGALDIPLVVMATRWFRGLHPVAPEMAHEMRNTLLICVVALTVFTAWLVDQRRRVVELEQRTCQLERQAQAEC